MQIFLKYFFSYLVWIPSSHAPQLAARGIREDEAVGRLLHEIEPRGRAGRAGSRGRTKVILVHEQVRVELAGQTCKLENEIMRLERALKRFLCSCT